MKKKRWEKEKIQEIFKGNKIVQLLGDKKFILLIPPTKQHTCTFLFGQKMSCIQNCES